MPGIDLEKLYADPEFEGLSDEDKKGVLIELGYGGMPGGAEATIGQGQPDSAWDEAKAAISQFFMGDPDRAEAEAAGIGLQPTGGQLIAGAAAPLAAAGAPLAAPAVAAAVPRMYGAYAGWRQGKKHAGVPGGIAGAVTGAINPVAGGVAGAVEGYETAGIPGAVLGGLGAAGKIGQATQILRGASKAATTATEAATLAKTASVAPQVAQAAATGLSGAQRSAIMMREAAKAAKAGTKFEGKKIWFKLDAAGNPTGSPITPGQASHLADSSKTWIRNMWGQGSRP